MRLLHFSTQTEFARAELAFLAQILVLAEPLDVFVFPRAVACA